MAKRLTTKKERRSFFRANGSVWLKLFTLSLLLTLAYLSMIAVRQKLLPALEKKFTYVQKNHGFVLKHLYVEGAVKTKLKDVYDAAGLKAQQNIFDVALATLHRRIENLPWVKNVVVQRHLPHTLHFKLYEHEPMALWQCNGVVSIISDEGVAIDVKNPERYIYLPRVIGLGADKAAPAFLKKLKNESFLFKALRYCTFVSERRWTLTFKNNMCVLLPENCTEETLKRLAKYIMDNNLFERKILSLDLRVPGKVVLKKK